MLRLILLSAMVAVSVATPSVPARAQISSSVAPPEEAKLIAARALIERILPPAQRNAMIEAMVRPLAEVTRSTMLSSPRFVSLKAKNPKFAEIVGEFMNAEFKRAISDTTTAMPMLMEATARAYARRFTLEELKAITAFYDTPAGSAYIRKGMTIMDDPDILAAQRSVAMKSISGMQERLEALVASLTPEKN